jgi:hypothetical protein
MDVNTSMLYTIGGYAALIGLGFAVYNVSLQKSQKRGSVTQTKAQRPSQPEPRKEEKKKKQQRMESFATESQEAKQAAAKVVDQVKSIVDPTPRAQGKEKSDEPDNREFARQLAKAKEGHTFNTKKSDGGKQKEKSVKQSRANKMAVPADEKISVPSSTTGIDADDDESSAASPEAKPTDVSGVADMLEPARAGPSVLRLTDTTEKKKPKAAKAAEPVETKKQRQNRLKAEAAKVAREEAEKDRKVMEEKQRREARIAEGRAAKDGSQFMAAVNGNKSAWTQSPANGTAPQAEATHEPLDTFEPVVNKKKQKQQKVEPVAAPATVSAPALAPATAKPATGNWTSSLPSEEEQLQLLKAEEDEWSTVTTKASKKTVKKSASSDSGDEPVVSRPAAAVQQPVNGAASSKTAPKQQNFGSFTALTNKDEPVEEEEEEWDV